MKAKSKEMKIFRDRWKAVEKFQIEELRRMKPSEKLARVVASNRLSSALGVPLARTEAEQREIEEVRKRWERLKREMRHGSRV
jgi:hypothetical protein